MVHGGAEERRTGERAPPPFCVRSAWTERSWVDSGHGPALTRLRTGILVHERSPVGGAGCRASLCQEQAPRNAGSRQSVALS